MGVIVKPVDPQEHAAELLITQLDAMQLALYPEESNHLDSIATLKGANVYFVGAYIDQKLVGIGALKRIDGVVPYGEIKRLYTTIESRGQGVGQAIMEHLETHARSIDIYLIYLETGIYQKEAIALYKKLGYATTTAFGQYQQDEYSVFMKKELL